MVVIDYIGIKASTAAVAARHSVAAACGPSRVALQPGRTTTRSPSAAGLDYGPLAARSALRARGGYKFDGRRLKLEIGTTTLETANYLLAQGTNFPLSHRHIRAGAGKSFRSLRRSFG